MSNLCSPTFAFLSSSSAFLERKLALASLPDETLDPDSLKLLLATFEELVSALDTFPSVTASVALSPEVLAILADKGIFRRFKNHCETGKVECLICEPSLFSS
jgi:hypothetical protein